MSLYIDKKYVSLLSPKLERFARKSDNLYNFRCPICGDSSKNKLKARGYIYRQKNNLFFSCHNCGASHTFGTFLKLTDRSLYSSYQLECYSDAGSSNTKKPDFSFAKTKTVFEKKVKINLPSIEELPNNHAAKGYVKDRKIPEKYFSKLYYAENFHDFVKEMLPSYEKKLYDEPRLVIPFFDEDNNLLGFQGRDLLKSKIKYITIKLSDDNKKVFGLDHVDKAKRIYVVEGPIDSLFLDNSLATMDASLLSIIASVGSFDYVFVYDNEPRNKDILKHMQKTIELGKNIVIWPKHVVHKDINEMAKAGYSSSLIQSIIDSNTFTNHQAMLEFATWKKA
jgi:transcription elongation factor Elf1